VGAVSEAAPVRRRPAPRCDTDPVPDDRDFSKRLPGALFPAALQPMFRDGWVYAAAGGVVTTLLLMVSHVFGLSASSHLGFRQWVALAFDPPTGLRMAGGLVLAAGAVALRRAAATAAQPAGVLVSPVLAATALLSLVMVLGAVVGVLDFITLLGDGVRAALDAIAFELAVLVLSATAAVWALGELDARRRGV